MLVMWFGICLLCVALGSNPTLHINNQLWFQTYSLMLFQKQPIFKHLNSLLYHPGHKQLYTYMEYSVTTVTVDCKFLFLFKLFFFLRNLVSLKKLNGSNLSHFIHFRTNSSHLGIYKNHRSSMTLSSHKITLDIKHVQIVMWE